MHLDPTQFPEVNEVLDQLLTGLSSILGEKLVGLYLYGSLASGDFDLDISDIDLLAATAADIDDRDVTALQQMHLEIAGKYPRWTDRLDVLYYSIRGLQTFKTQAHKMGMIRIQPFLVVEAGDEWLMNWYLVRKQGVVLAGPPPKTLIAPISKSEFIDAAVKDGIAWRERITRATHSRPYQAHAMLTVCRALHTKHRGEQVSKQQAASWAASEYPDLAPMLHKALEWRAATYTAINIDHNATFPETERFIHYVVDSLLVEGGPEVNGP